MPMNIGVRIAGLAKQRKNLPQYAGAAFSTLNLAIHPGDVVVIFTNSQATPSSITDNGSGGGNTYTLVDSQAFAFVGSYYSCIATKSATVVTVNGTTGYNIMGATFPGASGVGAHNMSAGSSSVSVTTTKDNSVVVGVIQFVNFGVLSYSVTHGTEQADAPVSVAPGDGRKTAAVLVTTAVPSTGTSTPSAATSNSSFQNAMAIEIKY